MPEEKAKIMVVEKDERLFLKAQAGRKWERKGRKRGKEGRLREGLGSVWSSCMYVVVSEKNGWLPRVTSD